jgi:protein TonB
MWRTLSLAATLAVFGQAAHAAPHYSTQGSVGPTYTAPPDAGVPVAHWSRPPSADAFSISYPDRAYQFSISGQVWLNCEVTAQGALRDCKVLSESPSGWDFGRSAVALAGRGRVDTESAGVSVVGQRVQLPINFNTSNAPPP